MSVTDDGGKGGAALSACIERSAEPDAERRERELLRTLFDAMPQLGWTALPDGYLDYYNRGWYEYSGTTYEEMRGWGWTKIHDPKELPRVIEAWKTSLATGKPWQIEFPLRRHDGVFRWFLSRATPIHDASGKLVRWVGINTDIDDQKRAEQKLAELDRAKTAFFSNVSHELRTPLTLILGPIEEALRSPRGCLMSAELEVVQRNAQRLLKLVNALLAFSRMEAGRANATFVETDLGELTREMASAFDTAITGAGLRFEVSCEEGQRVWIDRDMWERVVLNLLSNALKFTFEGSIVVRLRGASSHVELSVADTGTGIAAEELPHIFKRFHRVQGARGRTHEGSGIGLALVREIARMHGGSAEVQSEPGRGSTFTVRIPRGNAHLPAERLSETAAAAPLPAEAARPYVDEALRWLPDSEPPAGEPSVPPAEDAPVPASLRGARVLLAEDNRDMREHVRRILAGTWQVEAVTNGAAALEAARRERPDLIVTDVMMPVLDGMGLLRELRADPELASIPVIMLSARAGEEARVEGLQQGADDYVVKPFSARELLARVSAHLYIHELRRRAEAAREEAEAANRSKDEFLAMLGHELRNPLAPITTALHLMRLRAGHVCERERSIIERQVAHMSRLVDDLLEVSRLTRGKVELSRRPIEIAEVIAKAIEMASPLFEGARQALEVDVPAYGLLVDADPMRMTQVISNLLTNAAKYTPVGGRISVSASLDGGDVAVRVADNGSGISPELLPRLFDRFVQGPQGVDRPQGGLGLGLTIVKSLVELHGGSVTAQSEGLGRGSVFTVRLPACASSGEPRAAGPRGAPALTPRRARVLVVDDNQDAAEVLGELLEHAGYEAQIACDPLRALALSEAFAPQIALLDIGMPVMDGYELGRRLLESKSPPSLLVAVTGYGQASDRRRAAEVGFTAHFVKPLDTDRLLALLDDWTKSRGPHVEPR